MKYCNHCGVTDPIAVYQPLEGHDVCEQCGEAVDFQKIDIKPFIDAAHKVGEIIEAEKQHV